MVDRAIRAYQLRPRRDRLRDQGLLTLTETAATLGVSGIHRQGLVPRRNCHRTAL